jgi:hypothetical protein
MLPIITIGVYKILKKEPLKKNGAVSINDQMEADATI